MKSYKKYFQNSKTKTKTRKIKGGNLKCIYYKKLKMYIVHIPETDIDTVSIEEIKQKCSNLKLQSFDFQNSKSSSSQKTSSPKKEVLAIKIKSPKTQKVSKTSSSKTEKLKQLLKNFPPHEDLYSDIGVRDERKDREKNEVF